MLEDIHEDGIIGPGEDVQKLLQFQKLHVSVLYDVNDIILGVLNFVFTNSSPS